MAVLLRLVAQLVVVDLAACDGLPDFLALLVPPAQPHACALRLLGALVLHAGLLLRQHHRGHGSSSHGPGLSSRGEGRGRVEPIRRGRLVNVVRESVDELTSSGSPLRGALFGVIDWTQKAIKSSSLSLIAALDLQLWIILLPPWGLAWPASTLKFLLTCLAVWARMLLPAVWYICGIGAACTMPRSVPCRASSFCCVKLVPVASN